MTNWILIISILYLPPIILILSYRYKNKHKYIYSSIYIVIVSTIIILSLYSNKSIAINKIKINENTKVKNNKYITEKQEKIYIKEEYNQNIEDKKEDILIKEENNNEKIIEDDIKIKINEKETTVTEDNIKNEEENKKDELEIYNEFRKKITIIEKEALIPLRNCYSLLKKMKRGESNITELREEAKNAKEKCELVEKKYMNLKVPKLKDKKNVDLLKDAKLDLQKAFYIRGKAMENGIKFLDTKNPKYILKTKEELKTSEELVRSCVKKLNKVKSDLEDKDM
ncbi:hypothetical protein [Tepidibacter formicigenes]|jgi:hypothetical protein|uniref:Uncharacterized protein n=1 Tax=Tepidibacter formicigenes DSM 15518 TaxID=1123349 RepID=A0A1M6N9E1_9FIRM|nr:hypothetical protein [Tepidibacter formicigenes]SHJ92338.1 hypothetical protein SAMN02744037_01195 [Tepidibacter formicigenes DSM 15518]